MSTELSQLKKHFEENTGISVFNTVEDSMHYHWKRLCFVTLDCNQMSVICRYIQKTFHVEGKHKELCVKLGSYDGLLSLTFDVEDIRTFILT